MAVESTMKPLGWSAPDFELPAANPDVDLGGKSMRSLSDYADARAIAVVFTCNHCPYAVHVEPELVRISTDYSDRGVQVLAVCSNDSDRYPEDGVEQMGRRAREHAYPFPYLHDESQEVARSFGAACTPDVFVLNEKRELVYRGRIDETRPGRGLPDGKDLRAALDAIADGRPVTKDQFPSIGCSIKWRQVQHS